MSQDPSTPGSCSSSSRSPSPKRQKTEEWIGCKQCSAPERARVDTNPGAPVSADLSEKNCNYCGLSYRRPGCKMLCFAYMYDRCSHGMQCHYRHGAFPGETIQVLMPIARTPEDATTAEIFEVVLKTPINRTTTPKAHIRVQLDEECYAAVKDYGNVNLAHMKDRIMFLPVSSALTARYRSKS